MDRLANSAINSSTCGFLLAMLSAELAGLASLVTSRSAILLLGKKRAVDESERVITSTINRTNTVILHFMFAKQLD